MHLDAENCYRAFSSRDRRFEGRFVAAVTTTGVYCRPGCPAPPPRRSNLRFYSCPAAAEEAGFRPCLRCRPDASPHTAAWSGTSATVSRALRLISRGDLDGDGMESLAGRLGVTSRHLRRLFAEHLGASPASIARTRRAHFARRLIDETRLPMGEVARCSGFTSIRRFNHAIRNTFRRSPRQLRREGAEELPAGAGGEIALRLPYKPPFDWAGIIRFLSDRAIPGVEAVTSNCYRRTIAAGGSAGVLEVRPAREESFLRLRVQVPPARELLGIVERVSRIFDLGADPAPIAAHLRRDPRLAPALRLHPGLRIPGAWDAFELAVRAVLGQQVSVRAATTLAGRLVRALGEPLEVPAGSPPLTHLFPTPAALAEADLTETGLTRARAATIRALAAAVREGELCFDDLGGLEDAIHRLTALPGLGDWTANYIALRALGEPDAFLPTDLGLRRALGRNGSPASARQLAESAEAWRPWRGYAVMALWMED